MPSEAQTRRDMIDIQLMFVRTLRKAVMQRAEIASVDP